jgi:chemotaxis protein methyltransferase CheR
VSELNLPDVAAYRAYLECNADEWLVLQRLCRITISRFYRDRSVFDRLAAEVLAPLGALAGSRGRRDILVWSAACGSGEEPYTVALLWELTLARHGRLLILGTDVERQVIHRAQDGRYPASALRDLPATWRSAFARTGDAYRLESRHRRPVRFAVHDLRAGAPGGPFDVVLCRNLAFTYWDQELQLETAAALEGALRPGGVLVIGAHEVLPGRSAGLVRLPGTPCMFRKQ